MEGNKVTVKIVCAQILKNHDMFGKMDPYCIAKMGTQQHKTQIHRRGGKNPFWNETFTLKNSSDGKL